MALKIPDLNCTFRAMQVYQRQPSPNSTVILDSLGGTVSLTNNLPKESLVASESLKRIIEGVIVGFAVPISLHIRMDSFLPTTDLGSPMPTKNPCFYIDVASK